MQMRLLLLYRVIHLFWIKNCMEGWNPCELSGGTPSLCTTLRGLIRTVLVGWDFLECQRFLMKTCRFLLLRGSSTFRGWNWSMDAIIWIARVRVALWQKFINVVFWRFTYESSGACPWKCTNFAAFPEAYKAVVEIIIMCMPKISHFSFIDLIKFNSKLSPIWS